MAHRNTKRNIMSVSWGDHLEAWDGDDALDQPGKILRCAERWRSEFGAGAIYWREMRSWSKFRICFSAPGAPPRRLFDDYERKGYDEHELITTQLKEMGYKVYMYTTMFDEGLPLSESWQGGVYGWQSQFTMANLEYLARDREGRPHYGVMEYAYPDVRRYTIRRILSVLGNYDFDGVFVCTRSQSKPAVHGDQFGFNAPVVEEYERRYGVDIMRRNFELEPWRRLRGEGVTQFLRELRSALNARGMQLGIGVPTGNCIGPPLGNLYLDWRTWVQEKLVDDLVIDQVAVRCPSFWLLLWPKHQGYGYRVNDEDHYGIKGVDDHGDPALLVDSTGQGLACVPRGHGPPVQCDPRRLRPPLRAARLPAPRGAHVVGTRPGGKRQASGHRGRVRSGDWLFRSRGGPAGRWIASGRGYSGLRSASPEEFGHPSAE